MGLPGRDSRGARRGRLVVAATAGAAVLAVVGCYPNPDDLRTGSTSSAQTLDCGQFADQWCTQYTHCHPLGFGETFTDVAQCHDRMETYCTSILLGESDTGWTKAKLAGCVAGWRGVACNVWNDDPSILPGDACAVPGARAAGASCFRDLQCASRHCGFTADAGCGTCGPRGGAGQACTYGTDCQAGFGCSANNACAAWGSAGDTCDGDHPCHLSLSCTGGHCVAPGGPGTVCTDSADCDGAQGLLCNFTTQHCGQAIGTAAVCDSHEADGKVRYCYASGICDSNAGTCTASTGEGQACDDTQGPRCVWPAFCSTVTHTCTLPTPVACLTPDNGTPDGGAADAGNGGTVTLDAALTSYAQAVCNRLQACAPRRVVGLYGTLANCQARVKLFAQSVNALASTGWTIDAVSACAAGFNGQSCGDFDDGLTPPACVRPGMRAVGQGCRADDQCASIRCSAPAFPACGQCAARVSAGSVCARDADCITGLICGGNKQCVAPRAIGAACDPMTAPCRESLSCRAMTCATPGPAGTACADQEDCDERNGILCNLATQRCGVSTAAATCNFSTADGTVAYCGDNGFCAANGAACIASAADGGACGANGPLCRFPFDCVGGVCTNVLTTDCPP